MVEAPSFRGIGEVMEALLTPEAIYLPERPGSPLPTGAALP